MLNKSGLRKSSYLIAMLLISAFVSHLFAAQPVQLGTAWGETIGWIERAKNGGNTALAEETYLSGYIWSETTGWLFLGDGAPDDGVHYSNTTPGDCGVNRDGDLLSGYGWGETIGWIDFAPGGDPGVEIDPAGGLKGEAFCENCGWILFGLTNLSLKNDDADTTVQVMLDAFTGSPIDAFQFGVSHEEAGTIIETVVQGEALAAVGGADHWFLNIIEGTGFTLGCVVDAEPDGDAWRGLPGTTANQELAVITYDAHEPDTACLTSELGDPRVKIVLSSGKERIVPVCEPFCVDFSIDTDKKFIRGDINYNGSINIADVVSLLSYLFTNGQQPVCLDAADINDDGQINIADAVSLLSHLFSGAGPLPEPFETCGIDPTLDDLDCAESTCRK